MSLSQCVRTAGAAASSTGTGRPRQTTSATESSTSPRSKSVQFVLQTEPHNRDQLFYWRSARDPNVEYLDKWCGLKSELPTCDTLYKGVFIHFVHFQLTANVFYSEYIWSLQRINSDVTHFMNTVNNFSTCCSEFRTCCRSLLLNLFPFFPPRTWANIIPAQTEHCLGCVIMYSGC